MGANTRNFRQSNKSMSGNTQAQNYSKVNRQGTFGKILNYFKKGQKWLA